VVALAVYPGSTSATRPRAVVVVDGHNWPGALAASVLAGAPLHAPLLYSSGDSFPEASVVALSKMKPSGLALLEGAQAIGIGRSVVPAGYRARSLPGADPAGLAVAVERFASVLRKRTPRQLIVTASDAPPAMTMPAAGLSAQTGAPVLFVNRTAVPRATRDELARLGRTSIYIVGPSSVVSERVAGQLGSFGTVTRIAGGNDPASNAIAVSRFTDGSFGWGVVEPGHGLVFANAARPFDGPAAALLSSTGDYGPLLLLESPNQLPVALSGYLSDLQPGSPSSGPVHGVYNHGWLIGDESAISASIQASLDARLEITPRPTAEAPLESTSGATGQSTQTTGP
jgi:ell wall binding domain 2 (CWB2)